MSWCFLFAETPVPSQMQAYSKNTGLVQGYPCDKFPAGTVGGIILLELLVISTVTPHNGRKLQYWKNWWMG